MKQGGTTTNIVPGRSRNVLTGDFFLRVAVSDTAGARKSPTSRIFIKKIDEGESEYETYIESV